MKINRLTLLTFLIILIFTSFYSCKKNDSQIDSPPVTKYSQLPADVSKVAQWYDQQVIDRNSRNVTGKNTIDWSKVIKSTMPDGSTVYALQIPGAKNVTNELNISQSVDDHFYAVVKSYTRDSQTGITTLKFLDLDENIIEQGVLKENGKYTSKNQHIVSFSPPLKEQPVDLPSNNGGGDNTGGSGISIGVDGSGQAIVVITAPGSPSTPSDPGPVFSFPSNPSFPSDPGFPGGGGGSGGSGSGSNQSIFINQVNDPCLNALLNKIISQNFQDKMSSIISNLAGNTKIKITFKDAFSTSDNAPANTFPINYDNALRIFTATTTLSTDQLSNSSKEYVTTIIIHEIMHSYFSSNVDAQEIPNSHQLMADGFVSPMASYLTTLYPNMSIQDATALVWVGISNSNSYLGSSTFDYPGGTMTKDDIKGIYSNYVAVVRGTPICN